LNSLLFPRFVVFGICVIAFFVGLYFNKRDDERDKALYEEQRKRAQEREERRERERQADYERLQALLRERPRQPSAAQAMGEEPQSPGLGAGAAAQTQGQQPKRVN
jgi:hypothetical protein